MTLISAKVRVGYLPNSYDLDGAYIDGLQIGAVEKIVMDEPDPDHSRELSAPYPRVVGRSAYRSVSIH